MDVNIASLEGQLTEIVQKSQTQSIDADRSTQKVSETPAPSEEQVRLSQARAAGKEGEYLQNQAEQMNRFVQELELDIKFKINISETGNYLVQVLDDDGDVIKTIPGEAFVETREKIKIQVKGLLEDSQN